MGRGRPSLYTPKLAAEICSRLETATVREICELDGMPSRDTFYSWVSKYPEFADMYARAREVRAHLVAEEIIYIADTEEDPNKARVRIDARKWWVGKANAKHYGERMIADVNHTLTIPQAFEDYIRSIAQDRDAKVIDGTVAKESPGVAKLPVPVRS